MESDSKRQHSLPWDVHKLIGINILNAGVFWRTFTFHSLFLCVFVNTTSVSRTFNLTWLIYISVCVCVCVCVQKSLEFVSLLFLHLTMLYNLKIQTRKRQLEWLDVWAGVCAYIHVYMCVDVSMLYVKKKKESS